MNLASNMIKHYCVALVVLLAGAQPSVAADLPPETRDPHHAYLLGSIPFGSYAAAAYVGTSRLSADIDGDLLGAASFQTGADAAFLVAATLSPALLGSGTLLNQIVTSTCLLALPISHMAYAPGWSEEAVKFNQRSLGVKDKQP